MSDWTGIANQGLLALGSRPIADILTEQSTGARAIRSVYLNLADEVLYAHPWKVARKRLALGQSGTNPAFGWSYAYDFPTDPWALRLWKIGDDTREEWCDQSAHIVEGRQILTNEGAPLLTHFIVRVTDPNAFVGLLGTAMSRRIAAEVAFKLTQSRERETEMWQQYKDALIQARSLDSQQGTPESSEAHELERARL